MSQINVRNLSNENDDGAPDIVGVSTFSATSYFVPPVGTTAERPENPEAGSIRFNTDFAGLEYFKGDTLNWEHIEMTSPDLDGGARGVFMGGSPDNSAGSDEIAYLTISTLGNTTDFGNLTVARKATSSVSSRTRAICGGGTAPGATYNTLDYITFSSTGNAVDFGDLQEASKHHSACSSQTRAMIAGGSSGDTDLIQYITIATTGNSTDFGNLTVGRYGAGVTSNGHGGLG